MLLVTPVKEQTKKKDILKRSIYFRVNALNKSDITIFLHVHTTCINTFSTTKENIHSPCTVEIRDPSIMHSFPEWGYLKATANSNLPKRDLGIS